MEKLLEDIQRTPVTVSFLKKRGLRVLHYEQLQSRTQVFKKKTPVVVHLPKKDSPVGHFIVLVPRERHIEYFSSLARSPQSEMEALELDPTKMMRVLGKNFIYNRFALQSEDNYTVQDCAAWVFARVKLAKLSLREFTPLFRRRTLSSPDQVVSMLVLLSFVDT